MLVVMRGRRLSGSVTGSNSRSSAGKGVDAPPETRHEYVAQASLSTAKRSHLLHVGFSANVLLAKVPERVIHPLPGVSLEFRFVRI